MAEINQSGGEYLSSGITEIQSEFYFGKYLTFGELPNEDWNSITYDPDSSRISLSFKSSQGSTVKYTENKTGTAGESESWSKGGSLSISGKTTGTQFSGGWTDKWASSSGDSYTSNWNWTYTGDKTTKEDDFKYKVSDSQINKWLNTSSGSNGTWSSTKNIEFSNYNYSFKLSTTGSGKWVWDSAAGQNTSDSSISTISSYSFTDIQNNLSLSLSGKITSDEIKETVSVNLTNLKYLTSDYQIITPKHTLSLTKMEFDSLPDIGEESGDFGAIANNLPAFHSLFMEADNSITITSKTGVSIDAAAGNDKITGGIGNDTLTAGTGKDSLAGGKGNDTFVLKKSDYDFTSAKTVLVDTISDFKYAANGEQDSLTLDGFGSVAVFKSLAAAKTAGSTSNVIYETGTGKFWYNEDGDAALVGALNFATVKLPTDYLVQAGWLSL